MPGKQLFQKHIIALILYIFFTVSSLQASAADGSILAVDLSVCSVIEDLSNRLSCFDGLAEQQALTRTGETQEAVLDPTATTPPTALPVLTVIGQIKAPPAASINTSNDTHSKNEDIVIEHKGNASEQATNVEQFGLATIEISEEGKQEYIDKVIGIKSLTTNKKTITLSSGQIWRQMISKRLFIKKGDVVRITKIGSRKSFRLTVESRPGFIQVERIQ